MIEFLQGVCIGAAGVIGGFCVYLKLYTIRMENIKARRKDEERRRRIAAARAAQAEWRAAENLRQIGDYDDV